MPSVAALGIFSLRMYDQRLGRWFAADPYDQYHSPYLAMSNNPVSYTDPDGGTDGWFDRNTMTYYVDGFEVDAWAFRGYMLNPGQGDQLTRSGSGSYGTLGSRYNAFLRSWGYGWINMEGIVDASISTSTGTLSEIMVKSIWQRADGIDWRFGGRGVTDWYKDTDGTVQYSPGVKSQNDLKAGQTYLGKSYQGKSISGNIIYYNNGGSLFFKGETDAYNYIWNNTEKTIKEHLGVVFSDGVSVLPIYANDANTSEIENVGFRFEQKGGKVFLASDNYTHKQPVLGTVHSHNADKSQSEGVSGSDVMAFGVRTPGRPALVFENNENGAGGFLDGVISYSRKDWAPIDRNSMPSLQSVLDGKISLIYFFKQIK